MTEERLTQIRALVRSGHARRGPVDGTVAPELLAEVERLRAALEAVCAWSWADGVTVPDTVGRMIDACFNGPEITTGRAADR